MHTSDSSDIGKVWRQSLVPVIYRDGGKKPLMLRLPFSQDNYVWLRGDSQRKPVWVQNHKYWQTPKSWFNNLVDRCLRRYGKVYLIQPYRVQEKCAPACWNAKGHECQCSCMGANHGTQNQDGDWFVVADTFATRWRNRELACKLLSRIPT